MTHKFDNMRGNINNDYKHAFPLYKYKRSSTKHMYSNILLHPNSDLQNFTHQGHNHNYKCNYLYT